MKKQTAANNQMLARIKKLYNHKIFKHASQIMNTGDTDLETREDAVRDYLQQFHITPSSFFSPKA